jgi:hypothetical protein
MEPLIVLFALTAVFGLPASLLALHLRQRHQQKMRLLESQGGARVAELEAARADLEARMRAIETIVTSGDHDLEARLRRLTADSAAGEPRTLPPKT